MKIIEQIKAKIAKRKTHKLRLEVLSWSLKFAEHYSSPRILDLRAAPTSVSLVVLILTVHSYVVGGCDKLDKVKLLHKYGIIRKDAHEPVDIEDDERF